MVRRLFAAILILWQLLMVLPFHFTEVLAVHIMERIRGVAHSNWSLTWTESEASGYVLFPDWPIIARFAYALGLTFMAISGFRVGRGRLPIIVFIMVALAFAWLGPMQFAHDIWSLIVQLVLGFILGYAATSNPRSSPIAQDENAPFSAKG